MLPRLIFGIGLVGALFFAARELSIYWGWQPIHAAEFANDGCAVYHVMRGMEQDPTKDPNNASLLQKCGTDYIPWSLSQIGDILRFERPAWVRLRFDPIDTQRFSNFPPLIAEFPYPPVHLPKSYRVREWGSPFAASAKKSAKLLDPYWSPRWAELFGKWSLGRGNHEVWLGGATIDDPKYCDSVEHDDRNNLDYCFMPFVSAISHKPLVVKLPINQRMEIRLELLDLCRFGGQVRYWRNPLLKAIFGETEFSDRGCEAF
ncbi:MAG: hypothetical protein EXR86_04450 [Gammaproteobacteria bacterium]|nr:hypothetical protein [Gammaproteobacteria bacterium]